MTSNSETTVESVVKRLKLEAKKDNSLQHISVVIEKSDANRLAVVERMRSLVAANDVMVGFARHAMFGTFSCNANPILEIDCNGIKVLHVLPNWDSKRDNSLDIRIPFVEFRELYYCLDCDLPSLFAIITNEANVKINACLALGDDSSNGLKFDVKSALPGEHYLTVIMSGQSGIAFVESVARMSREKNTTINAKQFDIHEAIILRDMIQSAQNYRILLNSNKRSALSTNGDDKPSCSSVRENSSEESAHKSSHSPHTTNRYINDCDVIEIDDSDVKTIHSNRERKERVKSLTTIANKSAKEFDEFVVHTKYVMFGTYRCEPKTTEINGHSIRFFKIWPNLLRSKYNYDVWIPFTEMREFCYCLDASLPSLFIKPTLALNNKIQEWLFLGENSEKSLKFDVNSSGIVIYMYFL